MRTDPASYFKLCVSYTPAPAGQPTTLSKEVKPWACALAVVAIVATASAMLATVMGAPMF